MQLKYNIVFQKVGEAYIGVSVLEDAEKYPGLLILNESSKDIAEKLCRDMTKEELIAELMEEYDGEKDEISEWVDEVLEFLKEKEVI